MVPGAEPLLGGEQQQSAEEARRDNPEAVMEREASRTKFEALNAEQAASLLSEAFPRVVDDPAGGSPQLPAGQRIITYPTPNTAQLELPDHKSAVLESLSPIAIETSSSTRVPIDLSLNETVSQFQAVRSLVNVDIPKHLATGISLTDQEVSLTPVDEQGQPLGGSEGSLLGVSVLYANTQTDTDTLVKPTTSGFDLDASIRSVASPQRLLFRVGMPAGAELVSDGQGGARVVLEGQSIASVLPPVAQDATGNSVPVSLSVSGNILAVNVDHRAGSYQYPIFVDPSIIDSQLTKSGAKRSNWEFETKPAESTKFGHTNAVCKGPGEQYLEVCATGEYQNGEFAQWHYETKGNSKIFEFKGETEAENTSAKIESRIELQDGGVTEESQLLSTELKEPKYAKRTLPEPLCPKGASTCTSSYGGEKNAVHFQQSTTGSGSKFSDYLYAGEVSISEPEEHATARFNTTSPELEGEVINVKGEKEKLKRKNVMDGGGWLTEHSGAAGLISEDKGIGVSATQLEFESSPGKWELLSKHNYLTEEDLCKGYQCEPKDEEFWVLNPRLPNGEYKIRYRAEDGMPGSESLENELENIKTIKVDTSKPRKLKIGGLPYGNELSERAYNLSVEATDGEGTTVASSGIESIALYIDGGLIGTNGGTVGKEGTEGKCSEPKGECTASAKWTFNGATLGAGKHQIEVIARDKAGNEERSYDPISIRHSTPEPLGPGSVDLESGDYTLSATDVSVGSGLTVSRGYSSRATWQGDEGPLGPEWNFTVGNSVESLVEVVDHSMLLTGNDGRQTMFAYIEPKEPNTESPTYESPTGDSNLKLKVEENKTTKVKEAFYLENAADHTATKFTLPGGGTKAWVPTRQEGAVASDTVTYAYKTVEQAEEYPLPSDDAPVSIVTGPDGNLWFTTILKNAIGKITTAGVITEYPLPKESHLMDITSGPDGDLWFTNEDKIGKVTTSGEITEYPIAVGSAAKGIVAGLENDVWFTATNKIDKMTASGEVTEYSIPSGEGYENEAEDITLGSEGELWFSDGSQVDKMTTAGVFTKYPLPSKRTADGITLGPKDTVWFMAKEGGGRGESGVGELNTSSGAITEYALSGLGGATGITLGPEGDLWFTRYEAHKIGKITTSGVITEYELPSGTFLYDFGGITIGPDGGIWFTNYGTGAIGKMTTSGTITEPTEALAPVPAKVSCTPMKEGCRALKFEYASGTTATGESESDWGEYKNRLMRVRLDAYNPSTKKMEEPAVAEYAYDRLGRLRAEWDPRISPVLKTTYGYDEDGHVTALSDPGQEPWLMNYGTINGDPGSGRLLSVTRPSASAPLERGAAVPVNTTAPSLATAEAGVGVTVSVSNGLWSNSPLAYSYQWLECNIAGGECTPIVGATNQTYTPTSGNLGHTLRAEVGASNSNGIARVRSNESDTVIVALPPTYTAKFGSEGTTNGKFKAGFDGAGGGGMWDALTSSGDLWVTDPGNNRVQEFSASGEYLAQFGSAGTGNGQFKDPQGIAIDAEGHIFIVDKGNSRVQEFSSAGEYIRQFGSAGSENGQLKEPEGIAVTPEGNIEVVDTGNNRIQQFSATGEYKCKLGKEGIGVEQF